MPAPFEIIKKEDHGIWKYDANRSDDFGTDIWKRRTSLVEKSEKECRISNDVHFAGEYKILFISTYA